MVKTAVKKGREFKEMPVIDARNGKVMGNIKELKTYQGKYVAGFHIYNKYKEELYIPISQVESIGRDAVFVKSENMPEGNAITDNQLNDNIDYRGSWAVTTSGANIGIIDDVVVEESRGDIVGYELSDGYIKDVLWGRSIIPVTQVLHFGEDTVIVNDSFYNGEGRI